MAKKIVSVGLSLASDAVDFVPIISRPSLLDWDIILFRPNFRELTDPDYQSGIFNGKTSLSSRKSFALKETCEHWRREIKDAVEAGKTVMVHMCAPQEVYIDTGEQERSGTGKNQKVTDLVTVFDNYQSIPLKLEWDGRTGKEMVLRPAYREMLASYWEKFGGISNYEVTFSEVDKQACITTRHGNKAVGVHRAAGQLGGNLLLLPDLDFSPKEFFDWEGVEDDDDHDAFTDAARRFAASYVTEIVD